MCPLKFVIFNIQGLVTKTTNKLETPELRKLFEQNDIVMLTETWGHRHINFHVSNFQHFELNRTIYKQNTKRHSGGIIVYVRQSLIKKDSILLLTKENDDIIWLRLDDITDASCSTFLCLCYNLPTGTSRQALTEDSMFDRISHYMLHLQSLSDKPCKFIICGDMNARVSDLKDYVEDDYSRHVYALPDDYCPDNILPRSTKDNTLNPNGSVLIDFCRQSGLRIANGRVGSDAGVGECTYVGYGGTSLIDYVLVSEDLLNKFCSFDVHDPNPLSDHCIIEFSLEFKFKIHVFEQANMEQQVPSKRVDSKYKWNKSKSDQYRNKIASDEVGSRFAEVFNDLNNNDDTASIDTCLDNFVSIIDDVCKPLFEKPCKKTVSDLKTNSFVYSHDCELKKMKFFDNLNNYRKNKNDFNRREMVKSRSEFKSSVRKFKRDCQKNKTEKLINTRFKDAKEYWRLLKESQHCGNSTSLSAKHFAQYFQSINDPQDQFYQADEDVLAFNERFLNDETQIMFDELNVNIAQQEILKAIKELKPNRSGGPDKVINEFFIHGRDTLLPHLQTLFNILLDKGYFPSTWTEGYIVPIHKKGSINEVDNYRGITLLSTMGKLFTRILNNRLMDWAENYSVYIEAQAGFRANMGTVDNIFILHGLINHLINNGKKLYCAFVDFRKAFDFINRDIIWYKLIKLGVRGSLLNVIKSMYNNVNQE